jgi:hypothetical protein
MDFVHNQLATGRKLRMLTIVDRFLALLAGAGAALAPKLVCSRKSRLALSYSSWKRRGTPPMGAAARSQIKRKSN